MDVDKFVVKWSKSQLKEISSAQSFFDDLCRVIGHPTPAEFDPNGEYFTYEKHLSKPAGDKGFADVWYRGHFAWENKGKRKSLDEAYLQLLEYKDDLENPPLLVVCDIETIIIRTNFTNTQSCKYIIKLEEIPEKIDILKALFYYPESLKPRIDESGVDIKDFHFTDAATDDEVLILIANFNNKSRNVNYSVSDSIIEHLEQILSEHKTLNVRIRHIDRRFKRRQSDAVIDLLKKYNALLFIWGHYDDGGVFPRINVSPDQKLETLVTLSDKFINLANPPDDVTLYIHHRLPLQMAHLAQFIIGQVFYLNDRQEDAIHLFETAIGTAEQAGRDELKESLAVIHLWKGNIHVSRQDYQNATADYTAAIEYGLCEPKIYNNRGIARMFLGDLHDALDDFNHLLTLSPKYTIAYNNRGLIRANLGRTNLAIADYNKVLELTPKDSRLVASAYFNRGNAYKDLEKLNRALLDYAEVQKLEPNRPNLYAAIERIKVKMTP